MTDQFQNNPEDELPDWLNELRSRGSVEDDLPADPADSDEASDEQATPEVEAPSASSELSLEAGENPSLPDAQDDEEPDWLLDIRRRHQQNQPADTAPDEPEDAEHRPPAEDSFSEELPEIEDAGEQVSKESSAPDFTLAEQSSPEEESVAKEDEDHARWAPPSPVESIPAPILEVPAEPPQAEIEASAEIETSAAEIESEVGDQSEFDEVDSLDDWLGQQPEEQPVEEAIAEDDNQQTAEEDLALQPSQLDESISAAFPAEEFPEQSPPESDPSPESSDFLEAQSESDLDNDSSQKMIDAEDESLDTDQSHIPEESFIESIGEELGQKDAPAASPDEEAVSDEEEETPQPGSENYEELIDWLSEEEEKTEQESGPTPFTPGTDSEALEPAELPPWLAALKPSADQPDKASEPTDENALEFEPEEDGTTELYEEYFPDSEAEADGPFGDISDLIPAESEIVQYGRAKLPTGELNIKQTQLKHVENFERILEKEGAPIEDHSRKIALPLRFLRWLFAVLIMLAVAFPLFTGSEIASRAPLGSLPESNAFFNQIELLPANVPVLVAFEVQPSLYGEMKALSSTVLDHLLNKQARLVFVSTQPTGPALVERLLRDELSHQPAIAAEDYVNLGYLSGGTAALRYFASNPQDATLLPQLWSDPILESVKTVSNFGIILLITGDAEDGRAWIEQVSPLTSDGLFALSSAQSAPLLLPYLDTNPTTIRSLVSGLNGAAYYEALRNQDGIGRQYWDAYSYGLGAIIILILLGGLYGRLIRMRPERKIEPQGDLDAG